MSVKIPVYRNGKVTARFNPNTSTQYVGTINYDQVLYVTRTRRVLVLHDETEYTYTELTTDQAVTWLYNNKYNQPHAIIRYH